MNTPSANIKNWLIQSIRNGKFPPGTPLPTRHQLMAQFNVARATADRAINDLISESWAYSRKGSGTFASIPEKAEPRLFFVNASLHFAQRVCSQLQNRIPYELLSLSEVNAQLPRISKPGSRVVWYIPHENSFHFIYMLANASVPQILISRHHHRTSFVDTDEIVGVKSAIDRVHAIYPDLDWGLLLPPFVPDLPYWYEREIGAYTALHGLNKIPNLVVRAKGTTPHAYWQASSEFLEKMKRPQIMFCPEIQLASQLYSLTYERKIRLGQDLHMVLTDFEDNLQHSSGVYMLERDWDSMADTTAEWALPQETPLIQKKINYKSFTGDLVLV
ncbi:putative HTH-type transcriptional regulator YurK [Poriferisphaera corsica]|uniref:Putative HTH-type transcriptional regulator YurK n=1 Tax=Poriferisphaera corsica TaxID=2528020 RepID=A0A517YPS9_9BACT|nr:GntR family transcriptional regulator [Poriferisphaera corsica]QDU32221.1 putative HTH-type transcriptional regulator YurK [Poriferisphaera corsica]